MPGSDRTARAAAALLGAALVACFAALLVALAGAPGEFAYAPDLFRPLPYAAMRGFTFEQLAAHGGRLVLLLPGLLLLGWGLQPWLRPAPIAGARLRRLARLASLVALLVVAGLLALLRGRALYDDELTYRMQASLFAQGRLHEDRFPRWGHEPFTIWTAHGATGKYLFGEPLVQVVGTLVDLPALLHLPLAALTLAAWWASVRRRSGDDRAAWATLLVACSPMFLLTTATGLSHATSLAATAASALGYERSRGDRPLSGAALLGGGLGFLLSVRPQVAVAVGAVLGPLAAWQLLRRRRLGAALLLAASVVAGMAAVALYNQAITGSPLRLPWDLYTPRERYGFGLVIEGSGYLHGPRQALENLLVSVARFNFWWLGWPLGIALVLLPGARGRGGGGLGPWPAVALALIAVHLPYYSPGVSDTGPVYYHEMLLPASLAGAHALTAAMTRWRERAALMLALAFLLGTAGFLVEQGARLHRLADTIHAPADAVLAAMTPPALLLHETSPQEAIHLGWVFGFPVRERDPAAPVLTFPRGNPEQAAQLRRAFPERDCWYYRLDPQRMAPQLLRCERAEALLARPRPLAGPRMFVPSTARRLGLVHQ